MLKGVLFNQHSSRDSEELITFNPAEKSKKRLRTNISPYVMPTNPTPSQLSELSMPSMTRFADYASVYNYKKKKNTTLMT